MHALSRTCPVHVVSQDVLDAKLAAERDKVASLQAQAAARATTPLCTDPQLPNQHAHFCACLLPHAGCA
jgi:hypothetical protein